LLNIYYCYGGRGPDDGISYSGYGMYIDNISQNVISMYPEGVITLAVTTSYSLVGGRGLRTSERNMLFK
jgi:hypothetical protein